MSPPSAPATGDASLNPAIKPARCRLDTRRVRRCGLLFLALLAAACVAAPGASAHGSVRVLSVAGERELASRVGTDRLLVITAAWDAAPFTHDEVRAAFSEVDAWYREASYGKFGLAVTVTPRWLAVPRYSTCGELTGLAATKADEAAQAAGYAPESYDLVAYVFPNFTACSGAFGGGGRAYLNGTLHTGLIVHELGHAIGLPHANSTTCRVYVAASCPQKEYGNVFDEMGGTGHFNAAYKHQLGWLGGVTTAARPGEHVVDALETARGLPQALRIPVDGGVYWVEHREPIGVDVPEYVDFGPWASGVAYDGVLVNWADAGGYEKSVLVAAQPDDDPSDYSWDHFVFRTGQTYGFDGLFTLDVIDRADGRVRVRFDWADDTPPTRPAASARSPLRLRGKALVGWRAATDAGGSGIARYEVAIDAAPPVVLRASATSFRTAQRLPAGEHRFSVAAVDRAGNRSQTAGIFAVVEAPAVTAASLSRRVVRAGAALPTLRVRVTARTRVDVEFCLLVRRRCRETFGNSYRLAAGAHAIRLSAQFGRELAPGAYRVRVYAPYTAARTVRFSIR